VATEAVEPTEKVPEPERKSLLRSKVPAIEDGQVEPPEPIGSLQETKENLEKFIENLHKKASGAIQWLAAVEPPAVKSLLNGSWSFLTFLFLFWFLMIIFFWPRFAKDVKSILAQLEACFLGLAECQHTLETKGKTDDFDAMVQKAKEAARQPSLGCPIHIFQHLF